MALLLRFAGQWVAGETMDEAIRVARDANAHGMDALVNHLGEHYREKAPVEATTREYLGLLAAMRSQGIRGTVSLKPTQFGVLIDRAYALSQMIPVLDATKADGRALWLDMENAHTTDDTLWIGERLLERYDRVGICVQSNLKRTAGDLDRLIRAKARIRLVKGAYKESSDIAYHTRSEIDRAYLAHLETLFQRTRDFAVGSHDGRMIARALELARDHPIPFEFAMLQGVRDPLKRELVEQGHRVSEYIPYGPNWLPYFSRRLRERPRNIMTMLRSFVER
jgi:proline dehydrogenase